MIDLAWDDRQLFKDIVARRIMSSTDLEGTFEEMWGQIADPAVGIEDSFEYMIDRTLMRPRDILLFVQRAQQVALNRSHNRILGADIEQAEVGYSEESLLLLSYEMEDTHPEIADALFAFHGSTTMLTQAEVHAILTNGNGDSSETQAIIELLLWFGFLGVQVGAGPPMYAHTVQFVLRRLTHPIESRTGTFVVHPAFHKALGIRAG
jgi:hypothetical protein